MKIEKKINIILIAMVVVLAVGIITLIWYSMNKISRDYFDYNGFNVRKYKYGYEVNVFINENREASVIKIRNDPRELEDIEIMDGVVGRILDMDEIFISIDPEKNLTGMTTVAAFEIDGILDNPFLYNKPVWSSFTKPYKNGTVKRCEDSNLTSGVFILDVGDKTEIYYDKCVYIIGKDEKDVVRAADRLVLTVLGVMEE